MVGKAAFVGPATTGFEKAVLAGGQLAIYVGVDGRFAGTLIMSDPLRGNAVATLEQLRLLGVRETMLLTGDTHSTAVHIADEAGIARVLADCLPADKVAAVVDIGRHTIHIARTSIWTGILLSVGLMAAAAYGIVPAVAGALLQELVDLATILNALRALGHSRMPGADSSCPVLLVGQEVEKKMARCAQTPRNG